MPQDFASTNNDFSMLSLRDLLEARDQFHLHLMSKKNVVGTAVGRYLIRDRDPLPSDKELKNAASSPKQLGAGKHKDKRTLANSSVRKYSWPAILVFVREWIDADEFGGAKGPDRTDLLPKAVYMPDGRVVPICVVEAAPDTTPDLPSGPLVFPKNQIGGGFPILAEVQGQQHVGTVGCLVSDGHTLYALTNRHVAGKEGEVLYSVLGGQQQEVGVASDKQLTTMTWTEVYRNWPGRSVRLNLDVGLCEVTNAAAWTSRVYGLGSLGDLVDLSDANFSLKLITAPVKAHGVASGTVTGEVRALFYRYKSLAGMDYVADFLIGPAQGGGQHRFRTQHGDSGTLWCVYDPEDEEALPMPLAIQWGGHRVAADPGSGAGTLPFALSTCLSTVCNLLGVDLVRDQGVATPYYWGYVGHYTIGSLAPLAVSNAKLKSFLKLNLDRISYDLGTITAGLPTQAEIKAGDFVPLSDVPDLVWKGYGGGSGRSPVENPNHYADIDLPRGTDKKTMLQLFAEDETTLDPTFWVDYYNSNRKPWDQASRDGCLPFRVWQLFDEMVKAVSNRNGAEFLLAAGTLCHYVGDAC